MHYAKPRPKRPERPEEVDGILENRLEDGLDEDVEPVTDGGYVVGFSTRPGLNQPITAD